MNNFKFIDLFAGIGGIRIPFDELNCKCVFSSEIDKFASKTYYENFGDHVNGDITKINSERIPEHDILLAGFPCQPFSKAGNKKGFLDTRGTLFFEIERILKDKRPKSFLLENVKNLKGHDKGNTLKIIIEHLNNINYSVDYAILKSDDFGVPQKRERIYIVGFDKNFYNIKDDYHFIFPKGNGNKVKFWDILEKKVDSKYTISQKMYDWLNDWQDRQKSNGNGFGFYVFDENTDSVNTLRARYYKDGAEILVKQDNNLPRKLTPRECARLQGFPDSFLICVSDTQAYKQFGNSVSVPVIREIAKCMINEMNNLTNKELMNE